MKKEVLRREVCSGIAIDGKENKLESDKAVMMEGSRKREKIGESPLGSFFFLLLLILFLEILLQNSTFLVCGRLNPFITKISSSLKCFKVVLSERPQIRSFV